MEADIPDYSKTGMTALEARLKEIDEVLKSIYQSSAAQQGTTQVLKGGSRSKSTETKAGSVLKETEQNVDPDVLQTDNSGPTFARGRAPALEAEREKIVAALANPNANIEGASGVGILRKGYGVTPMSLGEAMGIGGGILENDPNAAFLRTTLAELKALGIKGAPDEKALALLLQGVRPSGFWPTIFRSLKPSARNDVNLLAEMLSEEATGSGVDFGFVRGQMAGAGQYEKAGLEAGLAGQKPQNAADVRSGVETTKTNLHTNAEAVGDQAAGLRQLRQQVDDRISSNRTIAGLLGGGAVTLSGVMGGLIHSAVKRPVYTPVEKVKAQEWDTESGTAFYGKEGPLGAAWQTMDRDSRNTHLASKWQDWMTSNFKGNDEGKVFRKSYEDFARKHGSTLMGLGSGRKSIKDDSDAMQEFRKDLDLMYDSAKLNGSKPVIFPWGNAKEGKSGGFISLDRPASRASVVNPQNDSTFSHNE